MTGFLAVATRLDRFGLDYHYQRLLVLPPDYGLLHHGTHAALYGSAFTLFLRATVLATDYVTGPGTFTAGTHCSTHFLHCLWFVHTVYSLTILMDTALLPAVCMPGNMPTDATLRLFIMKDGCPSTRCTFHGALPCTLTAHALPLQRSRNLARLPATTYGTWDWMDY